MSEWLVDQYGYPVPARRKSKWRMLWLALPVSVVLSPYVIQKLKPGQPRFVAVKWESSVPIGEIYADSQQYHKRITDPPLTHALRLAVLRWKDVLPGESIPYPRLMTGNGACGSSAATACADTEGWTIYWEGYPNGRPDNLNLTTIMMHEVGHLLGVPHITGDNLMDPTSTEQKAEYPTPAAITLAKLYYNGRVK